MVFYSGFVNEKITFTIRLNKTIAFFFTVPFDYTFSHGQNPSFGFFVRTVYRDVTSEEGQKQKLIRDHPQIDLFKLAPKLIPKKCTKIAFYSIFDIAGIIIIRFKLQPFNLVFEKLVSPHLREFASTGGELKVHESDHSKNSPASQITD
jgi:hypothetical protein